MELAFKSFKKELFPHPLSPVIKVNWFSEIVRKNVTIKGIWVGDIKNTWQAIELYRRKKEILDRMITHRIPLSNATQALQMMERREGIKIALIP